MSTHTTFKQNTAGQELLVDTGINLTGATDLKIYIRKPGGTEVEKGSGDGVTDNGAPADGEVRYVVEVGIWDEIGEYKITPYAKFSATEWHEGDPPAIVMIAGRFQN
jgi:hypothetical protein